MVLDPGSGEAARSPDQSALPPLVWTGPLSEDRWDQTGVHQRQPRMVSPCLPCATPGDVTTETPPYLHKLPPQLEEGPRLQVQVDKKTQWEAAPQTQPGPLEAHLAPTRPHCKNHRLTS